MGSTNDAMCPFNLSFDFINFFYRKAKNNRKGIIQNGLNKSKINIDKLWFG